MKISSYPATCLYNENYSQEEIGWSTPFGYHQVLCGEDIGLVPTGFYTQDSTSRFNHRIRFPTCMHTVYI